MPQSSEYALLDLPSPQLVILKESRTGETHPSPHQHKLRSDESTTCCVSNVRPSADMASNRLEAANAGIDQPHSQP